MMKFLKASFFQRIILPALLAIFLFIISVFAYIIPAFENNVMNEKRIMLHELTNTAWSILKKYQEEALKDTASVKEAQKKAISRIEALRYGPDKKEYFWITDLQPVMIMHPYVHELNGKSLQDFADPDGTKLFMEAIKIANEKGEGYISYRWQLKDDSTHIVPKISFVKSFTPWNWIIGTGIYLDDVEREISALTKKLILILLGITLIISLIILFIAHQSLKIEKQRRTAEAQLHESREKYLSLVESSTEGIILLLNNQISYSNIFIQNWLGYSNAELLECNIFSLLKSDTPIAYNEIKNETRLEVILNRKNQTQAEAILTILPVKFADKEGLLLTFKDTSESHSVKLELEDYKVRYNNVAEHSGIALFRLSMKGKIELIDFNNKLLSLLGYKSESDIKKIPLVKILNNPRELKTLLVELKKNGEISSRRLQLKRKDKSIIDAIVSLSLVKNRFGEFTYCNGLIETYHSNVDSNTTSKDVFDNLIANAIAYGEQSVSQFILPAVSCPEDTSILSAVEIMLQHKSDFIFVERNKKNIGIITLRDIVFRYINQLKDLNGTVTEIMTSPVISVDEKSKLNESFLLMRKNNISQVPVKNSFGVYSGAIEIDKLNSFIFDPSQILISAIENCSSLDELKTLRNSIYQIVKPLINETGSIQVFNKMISLYNDNITKVIINTALKETGTPPVSFAFITIGSSGREELAFNSDQDNAIIYEEDDRFSKQEIQNYFLTLSEKICHYLNNSGLPLCKGGYMAMNEKWCQPVSKWKEYFSEWINNAEPVNVMNISVFFDLRFIYGNTALFNDVENYVFETLKGKSAFFYFLAQSVIGFKPPVSVFGNIITDNSRKTETIDIKHCLAPVIMFARIYALYNNIRKKSTIERLNDLNAAELLNVTLHKEVLFHYNYLMQLRMKHQIEMLEKKEEPDNYILPKKLTEMEQFILKKVFTQISNCLSLLSTNFMNSYKAG